MIDSHTTAMIVASHSFFIFFLADVEGVPEIRARFFSEIKDYFWDKKSKPLFLGRPVDHKIWNHTE